MRVVIVLLALAVFGMVGLTAVQAGLDNSAEVTAITAETFTPSAGDVTQLSESNLDGASYFDNETVRDENGTVMTEGVDYEWIQSNGTVKTLAGGDLAGDTTAEIDYAYDRPPADAREMADIAAAVPQLLGLLALLAPVFLLFALIRGL